MSETLDTTTTTTTAKRPTFLTVLCILSFISAGLGVIFLLLGTVLAGGAQMAANSAETAGAEVSSQMGNVWLYLGLAAAMIVVSLVGVIKMWKLQKSGFYLYVVAAVAGIIVDVAVGSGLSVVGIVISLAFIVMYGLNLKHMK